MNYYEKAINVIGNYDNDGFFKLVCKIAEKNPGVIVNADIELRKDKEPSFINDVRDLIKENRFLEAMKCYKNHTGVGLIESREACDKIRSEIKNKR